MKRRLLIGSGNRHKLEELRRRVEDLDVEVVAPSDLSPAPPPPEEPHRVFVANAIEKALWYANASGLLTLADDSGLEVDALGGEPGVDSAYFAGRPSDDARNNAKLLRELEGVPDARRTARYRCVLVLASPGCVLFVSEGACEGRIAHAPRGSAGFGYDPLFLVDGGPRSFGELEPDEKDRISHRGRALQKLQAALPRLLAEDRTP
jgi:XTP/dITP diphosphohydrolase